MPRLKSVLAAVVCALASPTLAQAQDSPATRPTADFMQRGGETARYAASGAAATRAMNLCSGLWQGGMTREMIDRDLNGRDPGGALAPAKKVEIDEKARTVAVTYDDVAPPRYAVWRPVLGCVELPPLASLAMARSLPQVPANFRAPNLDAQPWPMGDRDAVKTLPPAQKAALDKVVDDAFVEGGPYGGLSWGVVIVADGKIVAERYDRGFDMHIGSQTHSAAKSFAATVAGMAIRDKLITVQKKQLLDAWKKPGDPRGEITLEHLLRMSSGLYTDGRGSPLNKIYAQGGLVADLAATNILDTKPGTRFLYSPPDTQLVMRSVREAMHDDARYFAYPHKELFWKLGMTRTTSNGDWAGDYLMSGQTWSTARDFARFGQFYLQDGVWNGQRLLPEGWATYVATKGPAQPPRAPFYGAQFWIYGGMNGLPDDAFTPAGGQGHWAIIMKSKNVVCVRRGFDGASRFEVTKFCADVLKALGR